MQNIWNLLKRIDEFMGIVLMAFIILLACANVFMRYVMGSPWGWVEEVTIFTFVWLTMFGAAAVIKAEGHCSIDVLVRHLPAGLQRVVAILVNLGVVVTLLLMIYYGMKLALSAGGKVTPILGIPYTYVDLAIPAAGVFMLVYYIQFTWAEITGKSINREREE